MSHQNQNYRSLFKMQPSKDDASMLANHSRQPQMQSTTSAIKSSELNVQTSSRFETEGAVLLAKESKQQNHTTHQSGADSAARQSLTLKPFGHNQGSSPISARVINRNAEQSSEASKRESVQLPSQHLTNLRKLKSKELSEGNMQTQFRQSNARLDSEASAQYDLSKRSSSKDEVYFTSTNIKLASSTNAQFVIPSSDMDGTSQRNSIRTINIRDSQLGPRKTKQGYDSSSPGRFMMNDDSGEKTNKVPKGKAALVMPQGDNSFKKGPTEYQIRNQEQNQNLPRFMRSTQVSNKKDNSEKFVKNKQSKSRFMRVTSSDGFTVLSGAKEYTQKQKSMTATKKSRDNAFQGVIYEKSSSGDSLEQPFEDLEEVNQYENTVPVSQDCLAGDFGDVIDDNEDSQTKARSGASAHHRIPSNTARRSVTRGIRIQEIRSTSNGRAEVSTQQNFAIRKAVSPNNLTLQTRGSRVLKLTNSVQNLAHPKHFKTADKAAPSKLNSQIMKDEIYVIINRVIQANSSLNQLTLSEARKCMFQLEYLPFIFNQKSYSLQDGNKFQDDIDQEEALMNTLIIYINPLQENHIQKEKFQQILRLLMLFVTKSSEKELVELIVAFVIDIFIQCDIVPIQESATIPEENPFNVTGAIDAIPEEDDTKVKKIFNEFSANKNFDARDFHGLSELQIINKFVDRYENSLSVQKFVKAFKKCHGDRFAFKQLNQANRTRAFSPEVSKQTNVKAINIVSPSQGKKVKDHVLKMALEPYTFSPKINRSTSQIAKRRKEKVITELGKSGQSGYQDYRILQTIASKEIDKPMALEDKYYLGMHKNRERQERLNDKRAEVEQAKIQKEDCTFSPRINRKRKHSGIHNKNIGSKLPMSQQYLSQSTASLHGARVVTEETTTMKFVRNELARKQQAEEQHMTFKPNLAASANTFSRSKSTMQLRILNGLKEDQQSNQVEQVTVPNGYEKFVARQLASKVEKSKITAQVEKHSRGQRYDKEKLNKIQPPTFLSKPNYVNQKSATIVSLDIEITPTKSVKINLKRNDDVQQVARKFAITHQLKPAVEEQLVTQLTLQMQAHIDQEESKRDANREPKDKTITTTISQPKSVPKKKAFVPPIRKRLSNMLETAMQKQYDAVAQQKREQQQLFRALHTAKASSGKTMDFKEMGETENKQEQKQASGSKLYDPVLQKGKVNQKVDAMFQKLDTLGQSAAKQNQETTEGAQGLLMKTQTSGQTMTITTAREAREREHVVESYRTAAGSGRDPQMQSGQYQAEKQAPLQNVDSGDEDLDLNTAGNSHHEGASKLNDPALNLSGGAITSSNNQITPDDQKEQLIAQTSSRQVGQAIEEPSSQHHQTIITSNEGTSTTKTTYTTQTRTVIPTVVHSTTTTKQTTVSSSGIEGTTSTTVIPSSGGRAERKRHLFKVEKN